MSKPQFTWDEWSSIVGTALFLTDTFYYFLVGHTTWVGLIALYILAHTAASHLLTAFRKLRKTDDPNQTDV